MYRLRLAAGVRLRVGVATARVWHQLRVCLDNAFAWASCIKGKHVTHTAVTTALLTAVTTA